MRAHTALHVVKGAVARVLSPTRFVSSELAHRSGALWAEVARRPAAEDAAKVEVSANDKVAEDDEVLEFEMERAEAEGHFGPGIYDLWPPGEAGLVKVVRIGDWEASCCTASHVGSTGQVGAIRVDGVGYDEARGVAEVRFHLL